MKLRNSNMGHPVLQFTVIRLLVQWNTLAIMAYITSENKWLVDQSVIGLVDSYIYIFIIQYLTFENNNLNEWLMNTHSSNDITKYSIN